MSVTAFILSSLIYSIASLKNVSLQIVFSIFLLICLYLAFYLYRYFMGSRREFARREYFLKSRIIACLASSEPISDRKGTRQALRGIYDSKLVGAAIEVAYNLVIMLMLLLASSALIFSCLCVEMDALDKYIILIACMQIDSDILNMFISAIRFEKALVSF